MTRLTSAELEELKRAEFCAKGVPTMDTARGCDNCARGFTDITPAAVKRLRWCPIANGS